MTDEDTVVRAMTDDGAFRVIAARTTATVRDAVRSQSPTGRNIESFGDLLTSAILYRETMAPTLRVQMLLGGKDGSGRLLADSHPSGANRGLVEVPEGKELDLTGARLQVMRSLPGGKLHQGIIEVPEGGAIGEAFMGYMQTSEQITSVVGLATTLQRGEVVAAGGYMVQLLPEATRPKLMVMTERLEDFSAVNPLSRSADFTPDSLLEELLYGMSFTRLEESSVRFGCWCSETAIFSALATLPTTDIQEMVEDGEVLEINCDYCGKDYKLAPERLKGLLEAN